MIYDSRFSVLRTECTILPKLENKMLMNLWLVLQLVSCQLVTYSELDVVITSYLYKLEIARTIFGTFVQ